MSILSSTHDDRRKRLVIGFVLLFTALVALGVMASNNWLPHTDPLTGKKTGWFGKELPKNVSSSWNPLSAPLPTPTPQLSKEYVWAGNGRLLAVEDANASAVPPADLAIWRPGTGAWWVLSGVANGSYSSYYAIGWGQSGDITVPGDYDGDGKTDFAIYRPSDFQWWVMPSSTLSGYWAGGWGQTDDIPVPADYDGDGKTDIAVWRPSDGVWYIRQSSDNSIAYRTWGQNGDVPAPADFDGDGKADAAVWRNSAHAFFSKNTINTGMGQFDFTGYSTSSTQPAPADYDGDGKADYAVREASSGNWLIGYLSSSTPASIPWQNASDKPVQNDYDGDGKVDIAVWRDSNGHWYIRQSANGNSLREVSWGQSGDIPVPAYYRR